MSASSGIHVDSVKTEFVVETALGFCFSIYALLYSPVLFVEFNKIYLIVSASIAIYLLSVSSILLSDFAKVISSIPKNVIWMVRLIFIETSLFSLVILFTAAFLPANFGKPYTQICVFLFALPILYYFFTKSIRSTIRIAVSFFGALLFSLLVDPPVALLFLIFTTLLYGVSKLFNNLFNLRYFTHFLGFSLTFSFFIALLLAILGSSCYFYTLFNIFLGLLSLTIIRPVHLLNHSRKEKYHE